MNERENIPSTENQSEFVTNPETGMLVSHGHEYLDIPRMRDAIRRANKIRNSLPPVEEGYIRLWRGNRPDEVGQNPSYTNSLEGIALAFLRQYQGVLSFVDVPKTDLSKYEIRSGAAPGSEFILTTEILKNAKAVDEPKEPPQ